MMKFFSPFQISVLAGVIIFTAVFLWLRIPTVEYCDLKDNPQKYDSKIIRVKATFYLNALHGNYLADKSCSDGGSEAQTAISYYAANSREINDALIKFRESNNFRNSMNIVAVGRFSYKARRGSSDIIYDQTPLQFEIHELENVAPEN